MTYSVGRFGGALMSDFARSVPAALNFFPQRNWREACAEIDSKSYPRAELSKSLEDYARGLNAPPQSIESIRALGREKTYAVVTGQQAGFLTGPLLAIYKALTAVKLARQLEREAGGAARFVPVFWVAGDDHDLGEIDHAWFLNSTGEPIRVSAPINREEAGRSGCDIVLNEDAELRAELERCLGAQAAEELSRACAGRDFESAFSSIMLKWLGHTGLVVAPSSKLRRFSAELLARNVDDYDVAARLVQEAGAAMKKFGYEPGFSERLRVAPHFFCKLADGPRAPIQSDGRGNFQIGEGQFTRENLRAEIQEHAEHFSSSAVLRPIFQDMLFPTAAAVLGPGELAYWAQLRQVHAQYGAVWPVIVPRATLTLIDGDGEKAARKTGLTDKPVEIFVPKDELVRRASADGALATKIEARKTALLGLLDALEADVAASEPGQLPMLHKLREKFEHDFSKFAERASIESGKRGEAKALRAQYLAGLVSPRNSPQERVLCGAQFMAKYPGLVERLMEVIEPDAREHMIVTL